MRVSLLDRSIIGALCTLDRFFVQQSLLADFVVDVLIRQKRYYHFDSGYDRSEFDLFPRETKGLIHASTSTTLDPSILRRPQLRSRLPPSCPTYKDPPVDCNLYPFQSHSLPCMLLEMN